MVAGITDLAHGLGLAVTAEGVETAYEHDEVGAIGCDHAQGFFYAAPMRADAVVHLLATIDGPGRAPTAQRSG
jgi:EAL domain-containing protein (putative c-di-GMP-specific phosphodiesterase class I)